MHSLLAPYTHTQCAIKNLSAFDVYSLNALPLVSFFSNTGVANYALSDLVLELACFFEESVVKEFEFQVYSRNLRKQWGIMEPAGFNSAKNKQLSQVYTKIEVEIYFFVIFYILGNYVAKGWDV